MRPLDAETLQRRLLLCLYGLGTNAGPKRVANGDHGEALRICAMYSAATFAENPCVR